MGRRPDTEFDSLQQQTERQRLDLLRTDLKLCRTLVGLAESEVALKNHEHAVQALARAEKGYAQLSHIFEMRQLWGAKPTNEIADKLAKFRQDLDRLQKLVQPSRGSGA
jgi:hypothetical protein